MKTSRLALFLLSALSATRIARSQSVDPSSYSDLRWRLVGPFRGGWATCAAGVPDDPAVYYFGAAAGGVWKTDDAGQTWEPIFDRAGSAIGRRPRDRAVGPEGDLRRHRPDPGALRRRVGRRRVPLRRRRQRRGRTWASRPRGPSAASGRSARRRTSRSSPRSGTSSAATASAGSSAPKTAERPGRRCSSWTRDRRRRPRGGSRRTRRSSTRRSGRRATTRGCPISSPTVGPGERGLQVPRRRHDVDAALRRRLAVGRRRPDRSRGRAGRPRVCARGRRGAGRAAPAPSAEGLYRSDDGGAAWTRVNDMPGLASSYMNRVTADPRNRDVGLRDGPVDPAVRRRRQDLRILQGRAGGRRLPLSLDQSEAAATTW